MSLFIRTKLEAKQSGRATCVLMGRTGEGKTTLANLLCGTSHRAGASRGSVTRELYKNPSNCGNHGFDVIDTPGIQSSVDAYTHAVQLRHALTAVELNTVFIIIKYSARYDHMLNQYYDTLNPIEKYEKNVVVMISHFDQRDKKSEISDQTEFNEICKEFERSKCANIIAYSRDESNRNELANFMYACMSNLDKCKIEIDEYSFFTCFNLVETPQDRDFLNAYRNFEATVNNSSGLYSGAIMASERPSDRDELDEYYHCLIVSYRNYLDELLEEFQKKYNMIMNEKNFYLFDIKMRANILEKNDLMVEKISPFFSYDINDKNHPKNSYKMCPGCGEVFVKTEGCDGITHCGDVPSQGN